MKRKIEHMEKMGRAQAQINNKGGQLSSCFYISQLLIVCFSIYTVGHIIGRYRLRLPHRRLL